jgi:hypothetical protein
MAVVLRATTTGLTAAKYDEIVQKLAAAGAGSPAGRLYHVCFGETEIFNQRHLGRAKLSKIGETLKPVMQEMGFARPRSNFQCITLSKGRRRPRPHPKPFYNASTRLSC